MKRTFAGLLSVVCFVAVFVPIAWTHRLLGGDLRVFIQFEALAVVLGGTTVALIVSFPGRARASALSGLLDLVRRRTPPVDSLVPVFIALAFTARKQGWGAIE